eukprot:gene14056-biopygen11122
MTVEPYVDGKIGCQFGQKCHQIRICPHMRDINVHHWAGLRGSGSRPARACPPASPRPAGVRPLPPPTDPADRRRGGGGGAAGGAKSKGEGSVNGVARRSAKKGGAQTRPVGTHLSAAGAHFRRSGHTFRRSGRAFVAVGAHLSAAWAHSMRSEETDAGRAASLLPSVREDARRRRRGA